VGLLKKAKLLLEILKANYYSGVIFAKAVELK